MIDIEKSSDRDVHQHLRPSWFPGIVGGGATVERPRLGDRPHARRAEISVHIEAARTGLCRRAARIACAAGFRISAMRCGRGRALNMGAPGLTQLPMRAREADRWPRPPPAGGPVAPQPARRAKKGREGSKSRPSTPLPAAGMGTFEGRPVSGRQRPHVALLGLFFFLAEKPSRMHSRRAVFERHRQRLVRWRPAGYGRCRSGGTFADQQAAGC